MRSLTRHHRRATAYIAVLGAAMVVAVAGISALTAVRIERRIAEESMDFTASRLAAQSAIDLGFLLISQDPQWRTHYPNGVWRSTVPVGQGLATLTGIDPTDGNLADAPDEPLVLTGTGAKGAARHLLEVSLEPVPGPLEALATGLHAQGQVYTLFGRSLTSSGAPISTNGNLRNDGTIWGNVAAATYSGGGTIIGTATIPAPAKRMPDTSVFDQYASRATLIARSGTIEKEVWSPAYTPAGATNPDGVYLIDTGGGDLTICKTRINGTLLVRCPGRKLVLTDTILIHGFRADYPTLVVDGNAEFLFSGWDGGLSEWAQATNFNPPGAPYDGQTDHDASDTYPSEIRGLVHVKGTLKLAGTCAVRGTIIAENTVTCEGAVRIIYEPALYQAPPIGYMDPAVRMAVTAGTWRRTTLP